MIFEIRYIISRPVIFKFGAVAHQCAPSIH